MKIKTQIHPDYLPSALEAAVEEQSMAERSPKTAYQLDKKEGGFSMLVWQGVAEEDSLYFDASISPDGEGSLIEGNIQKHKESKTDGAVRAARYMARGTFHLFLGAICYGICLAILFAFGVPSFVLPLAGPLLLWLFTGIHTLVRRLRTPHRLATFFQKYLGGTIES